MKGSWERTLRYTMLAGLILAVLAITIMAPWGDKLFGAGSPQRYRLLWVYAIVGALPFAIYFMYRFAQHAEWNAIPGRWAEGVKVSALSPYTLLAVGIPAAAVAFAALGTGDRLDFQSMAMAASASLFGGIASFFGVLAGQVIAHLLVYPLSGGTDPGLAVTYLPFFLLDAAMWAYGGYVYFRYVHSRGAKAFLPAFITAWILFVPVYALAWFVGGYIIWMPWYQAATQAKVDWCSFTHTFPFLPYWLLEAFISVPVGFLVGEAVRRVWKARK